MSQLAMLAALCACGGSNLPSGSVVNSPGGPGHPPTQLVNVKVTVTVPRGRGEMRPDYVSVDTDSLTIELASVDGKGVTGVNATTIETTANSHGCQEGNATIVCTGIAQGSPGQDVFAVTTYAGDDATGAVLSVGTVQAKIGDGGGTVPISDKLSLTLDGVIASLNVALSPNWAKRGRQVTSAATLAAYDASGAQIVGSSEYASPVVLTIQGDSDGAFSLHAHGKSGASLTIVKPTSRIALSYDGNAQAAPVTVHAAVDGPSSIGANANFALHGKQPPPPVGTIYTLNLGTNNGQGATVTEYDGKAKGNASPERTLQLDPKLYARSIAVDGAGNLYVGYFDTPFGFSYSNGRPDARNEIAIYAPKASGEAKPSAVLVSDESTKTSLFPLFIAFDPSGDLVTYGATAVDGNGGNAAVLTYSAGSKGHAAPAHAWDFATPTLGYPGPTGLALDASGNFYVNGALKATLGAKYGLFVAAAADIGNPAAAVAREVPWDTTTELTPGVTTNVTLDQSGEIFIANSLLQGSGSSESCQARANVFAAGPSGGITDVPPLRVITFGGAYTANPQCASSRSPLSPFFGVVTLYGTILFVADDFNNAIDGYPGSAHGTVKPSLRIAGSSTGLNAPVAIVVTSVSGRASVRSAPPH
jgi:hypothetical protein